MKTYGFTKGGKHSNEDFGLKITKREFNPPDQKYITKTVPFMNGSYNFSELYGNSCYNDRVITYYLDFKYRDKIEYFTKKTIITAWIKDNKENILYDDLFPGYYFIINESYIEFEEAHLVDCDVVIKLIAYPFMIGSEYEGNNLWDEFNFELDVLQDTSFNISGSKDVSIYNVSAINIVPVVICSNESYIEFEEAHLVDCDVVIKLIAYPFMIGSEYEGNNLWDEFNFELDVLQDTSFNISGSKDVSIYNVSAINIVPVVICSNEGNNLWDEFNFELDVLQDTSFNISGSKDVSIYNVSAINIVPVVICSNDMEVIKDGVTYMFKHGTSEDYRFELSVGENNMLIKGNGSIEFKFRKEE